MIGLVLSKNNCMYPKEFESADEVREFLGGNIEVVRTQEIPAPFCLLVDEEGALKADKKINCLATAMYKHYLYGHAIVVREVDLLNGERDLAGLNESEYLYVMELLVDFMHDLGIDLTTKPKPEGCE